MKDIVTQMLSFGKANLENGFTQPDLAAHLINNGFETTQINNTMGLYFKRYFVQKTLPVNNNQTMFFLEPNGYFDLLQIENTEESRKQALRANLIAIASIIISGILALAAILSTINSTPEFTLKSNPQLQQLITETKKNNDIINQQQKEIKAIKDGLKDSVWLHSTLRELITINKKNNDLIYNQQQTLNAIKNMLVDSIWRPGNWDPNTIK